MPRYALLISLLILSNSPRAQAYSVLTHEAIIDAVWAHDIRPLLLKRFPNATDEDLHKAHAYVYGGAILQDMGYYPFGNRFLSDLMHYIRSGDFVIALLTEAKDLNEYAFAIGALAHYAADNHGHREATNRCVPVVYPKLEKRFGNVVTYADDAISHMRVEFSFDVAQVAEGHYAPASYHDFIGFEVAKPVLERGIAKTYSLNLPDLFNEDLAIGAYRYSVSSVIPTMTKAAWHLKRKELRKAQPSLTKKQFIYNLSRSSYRKEWGHVYERPGFGARTIAFLFSVIPKVGPLRAFAFRAPTPATETMFMSSVNAALDQYRRLLAAESAGSLTLPNENFDTGEPVAPGHYKLADAAYARLLDSLSSKPLSPELRANILAYYDDLNAPFATKRDTIAWKKTLTELETLRAAGDTLR